MSQDILRAFSGIDIFYELYIRHVLVDRGVSNGTGYDGNAENRVNDLC